MGERSAGEVSEGAMGLLTGIVLHPRLPPASAAALQHQAGMKEEAAGGHRLSAQGQRGSHGDQASEQVRKEGAVDRP